MDRTTSNLTRFFRNADHFKALEHVIVPDIVERKTAAGEGSVALWSVGCSSGEEPLSLALLLTEILPPGFEPRIVAIDREQRVVDGAMRAVYTDAQIADVPERLRERYFHRCPDGHLPADELRALIRFECRSVEDSRESAEYDIVLCRNVLTYADDARRRLIASRLWDAMAPYSYLIVGGSESLFGVDERFEYVPNDWSAAYRKHCESAAR